ncbi:MAG: amidohydrolase family protein [Clostridiales bacterium]|nr:amidohydrolase family protein [Clostridiales bacterium]
MRIADSHVHIRFTRYPEICRMLDDLAGVGVTDASLLALPYHGSSENLAALYCKIKYDKIALRAFGGLHLTDRYAMKPPEKVAAALLKMGCDGFKIMCAPSTRRYMRHGYDDPRYYDMFALFEEKGTPINIHAADPEEFWDKGANYGDGSYPTKQQLYDEIFRVLDRHPGLRVVFAHFFFLSRMPEEAERVMETYPNVRFDLTPGVEMYWNFDEKIDYWHDFFIKYQNRILFGTDCNSMKKCNTELVKLVYRKLTESRDFFTQRCYGRDFTVRGLELPPETVERICYGNYIDFVGEEIKPVDTEMLCGCCERILHDLESEPYDPIYLAGAEIADHLRNDPKQEIPAAFCRFALDDLRG